MEKFFQNLRQEKVVEKLKRPTNQAWVKTDCNILGYKLDVIAEALVILLEREQEKPNVG